jgi:dTMP kinase
MRGRFITVEGGEGAGKSTLMGRISDWLEQRGHVVIKTREPGGTELAERIREIILSESHANMCDQAELLLLFAARTQHLNELIRPALTRGDCILCDRFTDATWAYQGGGRGMSTELIGQLEQMVHGDLQPDLTLLLDLPVEIGLERASMRSRADRIEQESLEFFERVRAAYLRRAGQQSERFAIIDASVGVEQVWAQVEQVLNDRLSQ